MAFFLIKGHKFFRMAQMMPKIGIEPPDVSVTAILCRDLGPAIDAFWGKWIEEDDYDDDGNLIMP